MKIALIGPHTSLAYLSKTLVDTTVELMLLPYSNYTEALQLTQQCEETCDAILFTGQTPYKYVCNFMTPSIPWEYLPRNLLSTMCALVKAGLTYDKKIVGISMDGFGEDVIPKIKAELQEVSKKLNLYNASFDILAPDYAEQAISYHLDNYRQHRVNLCLTGLEIIYRRLLDLNVPVIKANPSFELFQEKLEILKLRHQQNSTKENLPAVLIIQPDFLLEEVNYAQSELQYLSIEADTAKAIYYFAQQMGAAVVQGGNNRYYIWTTNTDIAQITKNFTTLDALCANLSESSLAKLSIGIGIGKTPLVAKYFAEKAERHSLTASNYCCYLINEQSHFVGPLHLRFKTESTISPLNNLTAISNQTQVGLRTLQKLDFLLKQYNISTITPVELATYANMTLRSMNRLLQKLENFGYVKIVGKQPSPKSGRPSRLMKFDLLYKD